MFGHNDGVQSPVNTDSSEDTGTAPTITPVTPPDSPAPAAPAAPTDWPHPGAPLNAAPSGPPAPPQPPQDDQSTPQDLLDLKQKALGQLSPLVSHLDQTPEERFRTLMMMIQATDDKSLLQEAYDTAQKITDEKTKAQALLDVVNEINYFTQHKG